MSLQTLASIYETLVLERDAPPAPKGAPAIARYQYDRFCELWQGSAERQSVIAACNAIAASRELSRHNAWARSFGHSAAARASGLSTKQELRASALADALAEILWIFVSRFDVWPLLYGLDDVQPAVPRTPPASGHGGWRWVKLFVSTYAIFHFLARRDGNGIDVDWDSQERTGWIEELRCVQYVSSHDTQALDSVDWRALVTKAYAKESDRFNLQGYFGNLSYFTGHNAEIAVAYHRQDETWHPVAINDQALSLHDGDFESVLKTLGLLRPGTEHLHAAVKHNLFHFQPEFLRCLTEEIRPSSRAADATDAVTPAGSGIPAGFYEPDDSLSAVAMTYNLGLLSDRIGSSVREPAAAAFATLVFSVPKETQTKLLAERDGLTWHNFEHNTLARVVSSLWEAVDSMKLPVSHLMVKEQLQAYASLSRESEGYKSLYQDISRPLANLLSLSSKLSLTATELSMLRGDHLAALHAVRHRLAMRFESGWSEESTGKGSGRHGLDQLQTVEEVAGMLLSIVQTIGGDDDGGRHVPPAAWPFVLLKRLEAAAAAPPAKMDTFSILSPREVWAKGVFTARSAAETTLRLLIDEWRNLVTDKHNSLDPEGNTKRRNEHGLPCTVAALTAVKRRAHTLYKPAMIAALLTDKSSEKTPALDDLAVFLPSEFAAHSSPSLRSEFGRATDYALFYPASFPFRSVGDFFGVLTSLCQGRNLRQGHVTFKETEVDGIKTKATEIRVDTRGEVKPIVRSENLEKLREALVLMAPEGDANKDSELHARDGLIFGDFFTPLMSLLLNRLRPYGLEIRCCRGNDPREHCLVFAFRRAPAASTGESTEQRLADFEWRLGAHHIQFESRNLSHSDGLQR